MVMKGISSSSVVAETIDEAPMAYKDAEAIIEAIAPNAQIIAHMYPVWNFKAK
jgi:RNA-splicing ligase RtcB